MDIGIINSGLSALTSLRLIVDGLVDGRDTVKLNAVKLDLTNHILEAQGKLFDAREVLFKQNTTIEKLTKRIAELEAYRADKVRYQLVRLGNRGEFFAYKLRPSADLEERQDEAPHFCCQPCFDAGNKVVLIGNGEGYWNCPICKTATLGSGKSVSIPRTRRGSITDGFF